MTKYSSGRATGGKWVGAGRSVMARVFSALMMVMLAATLWIMPTGGAQAQVTTSCPSIAGGIIAVLRPDVNSCAVSVADTNPNILIGNSLQNEFGLGTNGIVFSAEPGGTLSNVFYNAGAGDVTIPIVESAGSPPVFPCTIASGCSVTVFFTYDGVDYQTPFFVTSGSNVVQSSATTSAGDTTAPTVTSVLRQTPAAATTNSDTLVFRVTFDEDVQNVDTSDFDASGTTGDATAVSAVSASVYDVTLSGGDLATFNGTVGLTFNGAQDIQDLAGNALSNTTPGTEETYTVANLPEISVSADIGGAVADGGTLAQGSQAAGVQTTITFTVSNSGDADLTLATATSSALSNVTVDSISAPASSTVAASSSTTFTVAYTPTLATSFSFGLSFVNDDADENPYNFTVSGTGTGSPDIAFDDPQGAPVANGGTGSAGSNATVGATNFAIYDISNLGTDVLNIDLPSAGDASNLSNVTISAVTIGSQTLSALNGTTSLIIHYIPTAEGAFSFDFAVGSDDPDEDPFTFSTTGSAVGTPDIAVVSSSAVGSLNDGDTDFQGGQAVATQRTLTYTISNTGTGTLTLTAPSLMSSISNESNVTVDAISLASTTVAPSGSTTLDVTYTPTAAGLFTFDLDILSDDPDEATFDIFVSGSGTGAPEIDVSSSVGGALSDGGTDAQGAPTAGVTQTVTYTITNTGNLNLNIASISFSGQSNVTSAVLSTSPATVVSPGGGTTTFAIDYTATTAGAFSFLVEIASNDADENPFDFTVSGTAAGLPEIGLSGSIGGTVSDGGTLAQGTQTAASAVAVTFTVENTGTDTLTLSTGTSSGASNVTVNSISAPASSTVAPGGSTTFTVSYTPTIAGAFSFDLALVNDDADENPYNVTVSGDATGAPEIGLSGSIGGAVADGGTLDQSSQAAGGAVALTVTVSNTGTDTLTLSTATSSGASNVTVNSISAPASSTVAPGGSTTFTVSYTPTIAGAFSFDLAMVNDDADENPYNVTVSGDATGAPEIGLSGSIGGAVADGGTLAQGSQAAGGAVALTVTVSNTGTDTLTLSTATSSGASNVTVNSISAPASSTVAPGGSTTFTVSYTPTIAGAFSFDLAMVNDDADENPYNVTVSGDATGAPEIGLSGSIGGAVADGGTLAQGSQAAGGAVALTVTVSNTGTDTLTLSTATSSGASNVTVNSISAPASSTVAPGGSTTFTVSYTPTIAGAFSFDLALVNDDADENPYNVTVSGTATGAPEIGLSGSIGGAVADGGTLAQGSQAAGGAVALTVTVSNSGTDTLTLSTATSSGASNVTVNSISAPASSTVAPGGSTTFTVSYTPTIAGAFSFDLALVNDDADENPYNVTVSGTATGAPEIAISSSISGALTDGGTDGHGVRGAGSTVSVTYTIENTGTDTLNITTPSVANAISGESNVAVSTLAIGSTTVVPGDSTTMLIEYAPTIAGAYGFDIDLVSDDADETVFDIAVTGSALGAPEIGVTGSIGGAVNDGGTLDQGTQTAGTPVTLTFTVENTGTDVLDLISLQETNPVNVTIDSVGAFSTSTLAPLGGTATVDVTYTPTLDGVFSFDLTLANTDVDEARYNIAVSGTSVGAPEIAITSGGSGGAVADGGTDTLTDSRPEGVTAALTYTISNTGTKTLNLGGVTTSSPSNVTVVSSSVSVSAVAPGGTSELTFNISPDDSGAFQFAWSLVNDDADENPFDITVQGEADPGPTVTLSGVPSSVSGTTPFDITATFSEAVTGFAAGDVVVTNGSATAISGSGATYTITITPTGGGDVTISIPERVAFATNGAGNEASSVETIADQSAEETQEEIATFIAARSAQLLNHQPKLRSIVFGRRGGAFQFSTKGGTTAFDIKSGADMPFWFNLTGSQSTIGTAETTYVHGAFGAHTWITPDLAFGGMLQIDQADQTDGTVSVDGTGWLVGPYLSGRSKDQGLYYNAYVLYGQSSNDISPFGTFTDNFDTERLLVHGDISGEVQRGNVTLFPTLSASYTSDTQEAYVDGLGNLIGKQTLEIGQVALALDFEAPLGGNAPGWTINGGLQGSYNIVNGSGSAAISANDLEGARARVELGLAYDNGGGMYSEIVGFYDGIGASGYESYGASLTFNLDF